MSDLATTESLILAVTEEATVEQIAEAKNRIDFLRERLKELKALYDVRVEQVVTARGPITVGDIRYYLGDESDTVCRNKGSALETCLELANGDMDALCRDFLAANPFKHGSIKRALARFAELFEVVKKPVLKEGKPVKKLIAVNEAFVR